MGETNGEKLYGSFDVLIDEAEQLGFHMTARQLRKMRDRLPDKPTAVDRRIDDATAVTPEWTREKNDVDLDNTIFLLKGQLQPDVSDVNDLQVCEEERARRDAAEWLENHDIPLVV
jgi:hypothetical protein